MTRPRIAFFFLGFILLIICNSCQQSSAEAAASEETIVGQPTARGTPTVGSKANDAHPTPPVTPALVVPEAKQATDVLTTTLPPFTGTLQAQTVIAPLKEEPAIGPAAKWANTENYLILGTDRRPGWTQWRTDTIILVGLDRAHNRAAVLSIPRDLWVQIPNYGWGRINQADYLGERKTLGAGPLLVSQVLSKTLGIATQHWVRIQLDGFQSMVDAVGGVTVHLDCPFYESVFNDQKGRLENFALPAGDIHLDGATANWYVRYRYRESDIGRGARQRQVLWALREQAVNGNLIARFPQLWSAFQNTFETDLGLLDLIGLARFGITLDKANVRAGGITLSDLQEYVTPQGAEVLRISNPNRVRAVVNGVWEAQTMANSRQQNTATCKPLPPGLKITVGAPPAALVASKQPTDTLKTGKP